MTAFPSTLASTTAMGVHATTAFVPTDDGEMPTAIFHPAGPAGATYPAIFFLMDAPGMRTELRTMAARLAAAGYCVLLPDLYYRSRHGDMGTFHGDEDAAHMAEIGRLMKSIDTGMVMQDMAALITCARRDVNVAAGPMGVLGYCMSGQFALNAAARYPDTIAAAASVYGTHLMTDRADSPHIAVRTAKAELYVAWAGIDPFAPTEQLAPFRAALDAAGARATVELYPGVWHGFAFPERRLYDAPAAELHWLRLFALFARMTPHVPFTR